MFDQVITLNEFMLGYFTKVEQEIPDEILTVRPGGYGNSPLWIFGHLALCVDFCEATLGDEIAHPRWVPVFGPGSAPDINKPERYDRRELVGRIADGYPAIHDRLRSADPTLMAEPHTAEVLKNSAIKNCGDLLSHLLTTHLAFHTAQLSACRRAAGNGPMF